MLNSYIYYKNIEKTYKKIFNNTRIGFLASPDSLPYYKKIIKGKRLITLKNFTKNQNQIFFPFKNKKKIIIMVGNLKATFTKEGLYELSEKILPYLVELRKKLNLNYILLENLILQSQLNYYININGLNLLDGSRI